MKYGSVCSGIEAATAAWHPLGWQPIFFSEIEPFPRAVLAHHYPEVPCHGDFTTIKADTYDPIDLLVGGTPCQAFSIAGLRKGFDDARGNLTLEFVKLAQRLRPRWIVWENVPGVLSQDGGRAFGAFLGALGELGYGFAYRVLDAQAVRTHQHPRAVPQRRRRVFVVGYLGDWQRAAKVLFERESLRGDSAPSRKARKTASAGVEFGPSGGGFTEVNPTLDARAQDGPIRNQLAGAVLSPINCQPDGIAGTVSSKWSKGTGGPAGDEHYNLIAHALRGIADYGGDTPTLRASGGDCGGGSEGIVAHILRGEGFDASEDGTGRGTPIVPIAFHPTQDPIHSQDGSTHALGCGSSGGQASVAVAVVNMGGGKGGASVAQDGTCFTLSTNDPHAIAMTYPLDLRNAVRRPDSPTQGAGIGNKGDPAHTLSAGAVHGVVTMFEPRCTRTTGGQPQEELSHCLRADQNTGDSAPCVAFDVYNLQETGEVAKTLNAGQDCDRVPSVLEPAAAVRRLTPRECERLQGFPDDFTLIPYRNKPAEDCPDGPRYKALGNSMAVNCMEWIGQRIQMVEDGKL